MLLLLLPALFCPLPYRHPLILFLDTWQSLICRYKLIKSV
jgi:hypothetical protein